MATIESTVEVPYGRQVKKTWRLVETDNYGRDYPNEKFIAIDIPSEEWAKLFVDAYNKGLEQQRILRAVEHIEIVYKLEPGFEP